MQMSSMTTISISCSTNSMQSKYYFSICNNPCRFLDMKEKNADDKAQKMADSYRTLIKDERNAMKTPWTEEPPEKEKHENR